MLKAVKIEAYPVLIFSGDPTYVREDWASPRQFNHCIIAIRVGNETKAPTVIEHASLGRLLIFDATDDNTLVMTTEEAVAPTFFYYCLTAVVASVVDSKEAPAPR